MNDQGGASRTGADRKSIVIVGPCASGKSTLARHLRELGYDVHISGQEHSEIADLWQRQPVDFLIGLNLDLPTLRDRRGDSWSETLFQTQQRRLHTAYSSADIVLDTSRLGEDEVVARVIARIEGLVDDRINSRKSDHRDD